MQGRGGNQLSHTLKWLAQTYELQEGVCLPRCALYSHYLQFCRHHGYLPLGAATFGKVLRQCFPTITTRRLGTRGQSRYHYYGLAVRESSEFFQHTTTGLCRFSRARSTYSGDDSSELQKVFGAQRAFLNYIKRSNHPDSEKYSTFLTVYHTHCQRLLDAISAASFEEIDTFFVHFWRGLPDHLLRTLGDPLMPALIAYYDSWLYQVLQEVLVPNDFIQDVPESLFPTIVKTVSQLPTWLQTAMENVPDDLKNAKLHGASQFRRTLLNQIEFIRLARAVLYPLQDLHQYQQMADALTDLERHFDRHMYDFIAFDCQEQIDPDEFLKELLALLQKQSPFETILDWIEFKLVKFFPTEPPDVELQSDMDTGFVKEFQQLINLVFSHVTEQLIMARSDQYGVFHLLFSSICAYVDCIVDYQSQLRDQTALQRKLEELIHVSHHPPDLFLINKEN